MVSPQHNAKPSGLGNTAAQRLPFIQPKLTINNPGDRYEQEADAMAATVMRMKDPVVQAKTDTGLFFKPTPVALTPVQRKCAHCEEEEKKAQRKEINREEPAADTGLESYIGGLNGGGQSLPGEVRSFYEPRFGYDFSNVKVHTDTVAAKSAQSINALAYTSGNHIVFNNGQYSPQTDSGKRLLGHELTHVVQQGSHLQAKQIQRQADISQAPADLSCVTTTGPGHPAGIDFLFPISSASLTPGQSSDAAAFAASWIAGGATDDITIDGYASTDGAQSMNWTLSCNRAEIVKAELIANGVPAAKILTLAHGESTEFSATSLPPNRRSILHSIHVPAPPPEPKPKCGPDVTTWFVDQVNMATSDAAVLSVRSDLATAARFLSGAGVTPADIAEASVTAATLAQHTRLRSRAPAFNPTITGQLAAGTASAGRVNAAPITAVPSIVAATALVASAALKWKRLVDHTARYDFKAHVMNHPRSAHCPDDGCESVETGVVTMCPGGAAENCYESDLTGNLFYALIGRFIGWSELTLQLGSQLAELTDSRVTATHPAVTWDSPEDTAGIHLGFALPLPLTAAGLCAMLAPARASLSSKAGCDDCTEPTTAAHR
ncbi:MAG: DUF4157 domain-containing protein [Chitinophagaceae bacterium]